MIHYTVGDIFESEAQALVNPINCVGVMGRGLALEFKTRFPTNFTAYSIACRNGKIKPGEIFVYYIKPLDKYIFNFPTKRHWRDNSYIGDIESGMVDLIKQVKDLKIKSIAIPRIGCGLGGLNWREDVRPIVSKYVACLEECEIFIYE